MLMHFTLQSVFSCELENKFARKKKTLKASSRIESEWSAFSKNVSQVVHVLISNCVLCFFFCLSVCLTDCCRARHAEMSAVRLNQNSHWIYIRVCTAYQGINWIKNTNKTVYFSFHRLRLATQPNTATWMCWTSVPEKFNYSIRDVDAGWSVIDWQFFFLPLRTKEKIR